ncbi:lipoprotein-releasing ABC transporter permease subunit [Candidatus Odyssella acanthamoebae]|uniref:Multidrug ABC transporter substrate-binding protein n=1 Tax=Candidatus Odyssella acanthamoebae TaxID=91604 RepID=A0A077AVD1_9PROT|nr:lipoprotein-releasing ABC transporter permease subunit [Candidatus Paracaedibacter acanthamoebae]AIK95994.1 multidrug ABC transporter substrate-binding protein [Candidatus Paracaedibacter acanthamoebae]
MFSKFERMIAFRYLRSSRQEGFVSVIAWFSFIGIALGVATLIIVMAVMNGFRQELLQRIIGMNGHVAINAINRPFDDFDKVADAVRKVKGVVQVYPEIERQAMLMYRAQARGVQVHGMRPADLKKRDFIKNNIVDGTLDQFGVFEHDDVKTETVAIGVTLARKTGIVVGDRISLMSPEGTASAFGTLPRQKSFVVAAIFKAGVFQYDSGVIFIPLASAQSFFRLGDGVTNLDVFVDNPDKVGQRSFQIQNTIGQGYQLFDWQNSNNTLFQAVEVERNVMFIILTLIILIAAFNILSSLIMLVKDKTRDIAIMRTMGASQKSMMRIFFLTGSTLGLVGTALGLTVGLAFALNIESIRQGLQSLLGTNLFNEEIYFLTQLPCKLDPLDVTITVVTALILTFLSTLYPSWRAARLDPVEALRQ